MKNTFIEKIADDFKLDASYISQIIYRANLYYKNYTILKRNGDVRRISQASPELKSLQYWVINNVLSCIPVSKSASAYKKGDSIKKNAGYHKTSKYIFHTDIYNFFPSIHSNALESKLRANAQCIIDLGVDLEDAITAILKICFRNDSLCIGTVSSPIISNIVMIDFDTELSEYCILNNLRYSRYADDIYISSDTYIPTELIQYVSRLLLQYDFKINEDKTWFCSPKNSRRITGLVITNDGSVSVGLNQRNSIRKMVYDKLVHDKGDPEQILGYLSYLKDIEPDTYNNIMIKYSNYCDGDVIAAIRGSKC